MDDKNLLDLSEMEKSGEGTSSAAEDVSIKSKAKQGLYEQWASKGNYFIVVLLAIVSLLISFVRFDNATVGVNLPDYENAFGWSIFIVMTVVPAIIGIMIRASLRRQGIKIALMAPSVSKLQDEYNSLLTAKVVEKRPPRSLSEYERGSLGMETVFTFIMVTITTVLMVGVALSAGFEGIIKQLINFLMWGIFGIKNMLDANDFVLAEYKQWLIIHIKELKEQQTSTTESQPRASE